MKAQELKALGQIGVFKAKAVEQRKTYWKITDPRNKAMEPTAKKDYGKGKAKAGGAGGPSKPSRKRGGPKEPYRKPPKNNPYSDYDGYDSDERAIYCGFSEYDFMELMSQGVKPWDSDAEVDFVCCNDITIHARSLGRPCCLERRLLLISDCRPGFLVFRSTELTYQN